MRVQSIGVDALGQRDPIDAGQAKIHDGNVGPFPRDHFVAAYAVGSFTDHVERGLQRRLHALARESMILHQRHPNRIGHALTPLVSGSSMKNRLPRSPRGS